MDECFSLCSRLKIWGLWIQYRIRLCFKGILMNVSCRLSGELSSELCYFGIAHGIVIKRRFETVLHTLRRLVLVNDGCRGRQTHAAHRFSGLVLLSILSHTPGLPLLQLGFRFLARLRKQNNLD
ncbi:hypothetical protein DL95DRAFT_105206 [Leptodontidium sp. 2 PMI_412]|nr:hypothetical protein DL95DRAFT_105206 [Leptodontidium sp. 2 PMI_412]